MLQTFYGLKKAKNYYLLWGFKKKDLWIISGLLNHIEWMEKQIDYNQRYDNTRNKIYCQKG